MLTCLCIPSLNYIIISLFSSLHSLIRFKMLFSRLIWSMKWEKAHLRGMKNFLWCKKLFYSFFFWGELGNYVLSFKIEKFNTINELDLQIKKCLKKLFKKQRRIKFSSKKGCETIQNGQECYKRVWNYSKWSIMF